MTDPEPQKSPSRSVRVRRYALGGECGVIVEVERPNAPTTLDPMPPHACYRAANNVSCQVSTVKTLPRQNGPGADRG